VFTAQPPHHGRWRGHSVAEERRSQRPQHLRVSAPPREKETIPLCAFAPSRESNRRRGTQKGRRV